MDIERNLSDKSFLKNAISKKQLIEELVYGSIAGAGMCLIGHPFDTMKTRMQADQTSLRVTYNSIIQKEGLRAFYKGMGTPFATIPIVNAIIFSSYEISRKYFESQGKTSMNYIALSGAISGLVNTYIIGPVELVKIKMQMQKDVKAFKSPLHCIKHIVHRSGVRGMFQGGFATIWAEVPAYVSQFYAYEMTKRTLFGPGCVFGDAKNTSTNPDAPAEVTTSVSGWKALVAGGISGFSAWLVCLPADVIKTKIQYNERGAFPRLLCDGGFFHVGKQLYGDSGIRGLYRGFSAISGRAVLSNAIGFWLWELSRDLIQL